jgi:hypothetical protein
MNGIKVMFGVIGKITLVSIVGINVFSSCIGKSSSNCRWEKQYYLERWNFVVERTYKHPNYKATYVLETTSGEKIFFQPTQDVVAFAEKGDKISKEPYSKYAYLINEFGDSIRSRIFSVSCDSIVKNQIKKK